MLNKLLIAASASYIMPVTSLIAVEPVAATDTPISVIPMPVKVEMTQVEPFHFDSSTRIHAEGDDAVKNVGALLAESLATFTGVKPLVDNLAGDGIILKLVPTTAVVGPDWAVAEGYSLASNAKSVTIAAHTAHGLFNGAQTLAQLVTRNDGRWMVPSLIITDSPSFQWRGLMLDCGRHFFSVAEVCRFLDQMALHKFNTFHWHLTDDQGWRVAVKCYPKLTQVGAWRSESPVVGDRKKGDGRPYGGFYSQADLRTVVAYASARHINVVPEFEMPGHSTATIAAYPELGNDDIPGWKPAVTHCRWGVCHRTLAPKEQTFQFIANVFDEILPIFPGAYVHVGGDEAPKDEWKSSPFAQKTIRENGLKDEHELQSYFIRRVEKLLSVRGKRLIGWDEIQEGGLSLAATMMVWRDVKWAKLALAQGNSIVMAEKGHTYLDYGPGANPGGPVYDVIGGNITTEKIYSFEPDPEGTAAERASLVLGCQGQLWSEYIWSAGKLDYMTWPRACALAEVAWTPVKARDYTGFRQRLTAHLARLDAMKVNYRGENGSPAQPGLSMERTPRPPAP